MKLTTFLILLSIGCAFASKTYSQSKLLNLRMEETTVKDVLSEIESQSEFFFMYSGKLIDVDRRVSVVSKNSKINAVLDDLFEGTDVEYVINDRVIVLTTEDIRGDFNMGVQQKVISGTVTDEGGEPLPGVTVIVKGTTQGTVTGADGNYTITQVPEGAILQFSFVGMKTQDVEVATQTTINITMLADAIGLDEVVAIGYGTQNRQAVTGAVAVADLETFREVPVNNILETVKGTMPGLTVGATNTAGAEAGLLVRGKNSIGADTKPLLVVDGAIYNGSLNDIATEDVESFTLLKDASAAAVYGSRSSNGVILIKTKKGRGINGKPKFNVKLSYGVTSELKPLELYDADGYLQRIVDIRTAKGLETDESDMSQYLNENERENYLATSDHQATLSDPYDLIRQTGYNRKANISVANSTENSSYYISLSGTDQKGVILNDKYKNLSTRVNFSSDLTDWFNLSCNAFYSMRDYSGASPDFWTTTFLSPWAKVYEEDGSYTKFPNSTTSAQSPFWTYAKSHTDIRNQLNGITTALIKVPWVEGLSYKLNLSASSRWNESSYFYDKQTLVGEAKNGQGQRAYSRTNDLLIDNIINYNRVFNDKHDVGVTMLYSVEESKWESMSASAEQFGNAVLEDYALESGTTQSVNTGGGESAGIGMMARATYTYDKRYSLTGTVRRDGFSAFSKNKKWGNFTSVGFNWNISNESFMADVNAFDNLALRVSYGSNGNQSIDPYSTLATVATSKYILAGDPGYTITQYISSLDLNNLGWEASTGTNIGIDFAVLNNRISGSLEGYLTKTTDLIFNRSLPSASGFGSIKDNIGEIQNKGFELSLHSENIQKSDMQWSSDFAFSLNRNKVVTIFGIDEDGDGVEDDLIADGIFIGRSLGTIYDVKVLGIYQQEDEDNGTIMEGQRPGDYNIEDINEDGSISSDDKQFLGNTKPNFTWSLTNTLKYKDFTLMAYVYSIWGGNGYYQATVNPHRDAYMDRTDINHPVYDYWTPENTGAEFPGLDSHNAAYKANKWYDRSFIKLQKVSLSYNLDNLVKPVGINNMLLSLSADNLLTWAPHWKGLDAETAQGLNAGSRPSMRTYLFTLSFNF